MIRWRCTLCGECCKRYVPLVTPRDVERIQAASQLSLAAFVSFYGSDHFDEGLEDSDERLFQTKDGKLVMGLSRVVLEGEDQEGCIFLKNNLCSIHAAKPLICRQYPFEPQDYDSPEEPFRLVENVCFGRHAEDQEVDENPVRREFQVYKASYDEYTGQVARWNADSSSARRSIEDFLAFIGLQWS